MKKATSQFANYLSDPILDLQGLVDKTIRRMEGIKFEGFVGTGLSGTMVAPVLAYAMKKRFAIVRKQDDRSHHSSGEVESGLQDGDRWVFIDDFTSSGSTRSRAVHAMNRHNPKAHLVGQYLYSHVARFEQLHIAEVPELYQDGLSA